MGRLKLKLRVTRVYDPDLSPHHRTLPEPLYRFVAELQKFVSQFGGICYKLLQRALKIGSLS